MQSSSPHMGGSWDFRRRVLCRKRVTAVNEFSSHGPALVRYILVHEPVLVRLPSLVATFGVLQIIVISRGSKVYRFSAVG